MSKEISERLSRAADTIEKGWCQARFLIHGNGISKVCLATALAFGTNFPKDTLIGNAVHNEFWGGQELMKAASIVVKSFGIEPATHPSEVVVQICNINNSEFTTQGLLVGRLRELAAEVA